MYSGLAANRVDSISSNYKCGPVYCLPIVCVLKNTAKIGRVKNHSVENTGTIFLFVVNFIFKPPVRQAAVHWQLSTSPVCTRRPTVQSEGQRQQRELEVDFLKDQTW